MLLQAVGREEPLGHLEEGPFWLWEGVWGARAWKAVGMGGPGSEGVRYREEELSLALFVGQYSGLSAKACGLQWLGFTPLPLDL